MSGSRQKVRLLKKTPKPNEKNNGIPSNEQTNKLIEHYRKGRYREAENLAIFMTQQFPSHLVGWKALGSVLAQTGRISDTSSSIPIVMIIRV